MGAGFLWGMMKTLLNERVVRVALLYEYTKISWIILFKMASFIERELYLNEQFLKRLIPMIGKPLNLALL